MCSIYIYRLDARCVVFTFLGWMLDAESRPTMKELAEECAKMARDPGRYLVVEVSMWLCPKNFISIKYLCVKMVCF